MTTRPTGACLVLVTQVNMVRGPHPTELREAKGCSWSGQRLRSVAPPAGIGPPVLAIQSLSSGACGSCPYSGETVTEWPLLPRSGSCGGGHNAGAAGHSAILRARQLGSQALLFAPQRVCVIPQAFAFRVRQPPHCLQMSLVQRYVSRAHVHTTVRGAKTSRAKTPPGRAARRQPCSDAKRGHEARTRR